MPPEQVTSRNGEIGPWSDVFSLGATLYHLLSGRPPFTGDSSQDIIMKVLTESPPRLVGVPLALEGIVLKCLEKEPKDRYPSMAELIADLDAYTAGDVKKITAPPLTRWRRARRWAKRNRRAGAVAALVVALMAGAAVLGGGVWPKRGTEVAASTAPLDPEAEFVSRGRKTLAEGKRLDLIGETGARPTPAGGSAPARSARSKVRTSRSRLWPAGTRSSSCSPIRASTATPSRGRSSKSKPRGR